MARRLLRWRLAGNPRTTARRAVRLLLLLNRKSPPRVASATLRCLWNGWPTSRRMRSLRGEFHRCRMGCTQADDAIEHYAYCPVIWSFLAAPRPTGLGLPLHLRSLEGFLGLDCRTTEDEKLKLGIGMYAVGRTLLTLERHHEAVPGPLLRLYAARAR